MHIALLALLLLGACDLPRPAITELPACGDGRVGDGENCDTAIAAGLPGACPTSCENAGPCTRPVLEMDSPCEALCGWQDIVEIAHGDGCCPPGADRWTDDDCASICGDGIIDDDERCETSSLVSEGETSCTEWCFDDDVCTTDTPDIRFAVCRVEYCSFQPIYSVNDRDLCCPPGGSAATDADCAHLCGSRDDAECPRSARPCDMTGAWIVEQYTSVDWSSPESSLPFRDEILTWHYYRIRQELDVFVIEEVLNCGFASNGISGVEISDATLAALATRESAGPGRAGVYRQIGDGLCEFQLERSYDLSGADPATYLTSVWRVGAPPLPLSEFPALPSGPPGLQDWDLDGYVGITVRSIDGRRFVARRGWTEHSGLTPRFSNVIGGDGQIVVRWDGEEFVSPQSESVASFRWSPVGDGWVRYARTTLEVTDPRRTCIAVQNLARRADTWATR